MFYCLPWILDLHTRKLLLLLARPPPQAVFPVGQLSAMSKIESTKPTHIVGCGLSAMMALLCGLRFQPEEIVYCLFDRDTTKPTTRIDNMRGGCQSRERVAPRCKLFYLKIETNSIRCIPHQNQTTTTCLCQSNDSCT